MNKASQFIIIGASALALAACSNSDDASTESMPESVEVRADAALEGVSEEPVADAQAAVVEEAPAEEAPAAEPAE